MSWDEVPKGKRAERLDVESGLRGQGVLTEPLVQWLATQHMIVADLLNRIEQLEAERDRAGRGN